MVKLYVTVSQELPGKDNWQITVRNLNAHESADKANMVQLAADLEDFLSQRAAMRKFMGVLNK